MPERSLEFHEPPDRERVPVLLRWDALELAQGALPVTTVIEQMTQVDPGLMQIGVQAERAPYLSTRAHIVTQTV